MSHHVLEPFDSVGPGERAILDSIQVLGNSIKTIILRLGGGLLLTHLNLIQVRLNQKTVWEMTGTEIDKINKYLGIPADAAYLELPWDDITAALPGSDGEDIGALDTTLGVNRYQVWVDIDALAPAPSTLSARAELIGPQARKGREANVTPLMRSLVRSTLTPNTAAEHTFKPDFGQNANALLARLYVFHTNLTALEVRKNNVPLFEEVTVADNEFIQKRHGRVPQTGLYVFDPIASGDQKKMIRTAGGRFQWLFTTSAADTLTTIADIRAPFQFL